MYRYVWTKKLKTKAHIATDSGTLCKLQNNLTPDLRFYLTQRANNIPTGRRICGLCRGISRRKIQRSL